MSADIHLRIIKMKQTIVILEKSSGMLLIAMEIVENMYKCQCNRNAECDECYKTFCTKLHGFCQFRLIHHCFLLCSFIRRYTNVD